MSDIGLNLDGLITFLAATVLAALLALSIVVVSCITVIRARRHRNQSPVRVCFRKLSESVPALLPAC